MLYYVGQGIGIVATVFSILMPILKKKTHMLINTIVVNILMALNFVLIGQIGSAACLCMVAVAQSFVSLYHEKKGNKINVAEIIIFLILYVTCGFAGIMLAPGFVMEISYRNILELLPIAGSIMCMTFVFVEDEQKARKLLLATALIWTVYTALVGSSTIFAQLFTVVTTCVSLYKYRKRPKYNNAE